MACKKEYPHYGTNLLKIVCDILDVISNLVLVCVELVCHSFTILVYKVSLPGTLSTRDYYIPIVRHVYHVHNNACISMEGKHT